MACGVRMAKTLNNDFTDPSNACVKQSFLHNFIDTVRFALKMVKAQKHFLDVFSLCPTNATLLAAA